jgi:hypothetical protein
MDLLTAMQIRSSAGDFFHIPRNDPFSYTSTFGILKWAFKGLPQFQKTKFVKFNEILCFTRRINSF